MGRFTVPEAARILGITTDAVRMRLSRGTLRSEKVEGRVCVLLDDDLTGDASGVAPSALVDELRAHNTTLREQLEAEREPNRENRRIIAALTSRIPELEAPREAPGAPETAPAKEPERVEPRSSTGGPQEAAERPEERLSWWRRWFGG